MSDKPNVARAGGIMIASLVLSRVLGLVRDMVMSGMFGSSAATDAYTAAFSVPDLLFFLIAGGALSSAFIPVFSEYLHTKREDDAWKVFSVITTVMSTIIVAVVLVSWAFAPQLMHLVGPGLTGDRFNEAVYMSRILLPAQFAFFIGGIFFGTLYARQIFAVPGLGPNIYNLGIILGAIVLGRYVHPGISGMAWGALVGAYLGNIVVPLFAMRKVGARFAVSFDCSHPGVKQVFRLMLPVVFGLSLPGVYDLFARYFGSFYPEGVISWLRYANLLMQAPLGVFGQSLAIAAFPALSQFYAQERMDLFRGQVSGTIRTVLYLSVPVSVLFLVASPSIVSTIYQHGKFTAHDTEQVARLLQLYGIGVWAWCLHPVLMRAFFAVHNTILPVVLGTITTFVFVGAAFAFKSSVGFEILPIASSIAATGLVFALLIAIHTRIGALDLKGIGLTAGKAFIASLAFAALTYGLFHSPLAHFASSSKLMSVGLFVLITLPGAWIYYFVTRALGMPEAATISRAMNRINPARRRAVSDSAER